MNVPDKDPAPDGLWARLRASWRWDAVVVVVVGVVAVLGLLWLAGLFPWVGW